MADEVRKRTLYAKYLAKTMMTNHNILLQSELGISRLLAASYIIQRNNTHEIITRLNRELDTSVYGGVLWLFGFSAGDS